MPVEIIMPKVDMDMASGRIMIWHVAEGHAVSKGDPLFDIETDKAAMEVEATESGILHHATPEGTDVPIGAAVGWLYAEEEAVGDPPAPVAPRQSVAMVSEPDEVPVIPKAETAGGEKTRATPLARSLARENGLEIGAVTGSGPKGRVQAQDVRHALDRSVTPAIPAAFVHETGTLAVTRSKAGTGTPVVLIHGFANDASSWAPVEAHLKPHPLIRIDLPCHGKSPKLRITSFAEMVKELRKTLDALNLPQVHLVGHSLGGALALALADTRPKSVASLSLIAPAGLGPDVNGKTLSGICKATRSESLGPWLKTLVANEALVTDSYVRIAMAGRADPGLRAAQQALSDVVFPDGVQAFDLRAALHRIEMPARIIWGKQDAIIPWRHALCAPGRIGLHLFDGVGHMPQIEIADEVGKLLKAIL